jgi:hypothetical protein
MRFFVMSDFTPGPTVIKGILRRDCTICGFDMIGPADGDVVAYVARRADAHLYAAASDLFDACAEFVRKVECGEAKSTRSYRQMKDVLAKARGETK